MAKIFQQIGFEMENFQWLTEEMIGRHHKNLTKTINELLKNYQYMIKTAERAQKQAEIQAQRQKEVENSIQSYRNQVLSKD
jgi:hypothetical protein